MFKTFDELPLELQNKFKSNNRPSVLNRSKNAYVSFINILNKVNLKTNIRKVWI